MTHVLNSESVQQTSSSGRSDGHLPGSSSAPHWFMQSGRRSSFSGRQAYMHSETCSRCSGAGCACHCVLMEHPDPTRTSAIATVNALTAMVLPNRERGVTGGLRVVPAALPVPDLWA